MNGSLTVTPSLTFTHPKLVLNHLLNSKRPVSEICADKDSVFRIMKDQQNDINLVDLNASKAPAPAIDLPATGDTPAEIKPETESNCIKNYTNFSRNIRQEKVITISEDKTKEGCLNQLMSNFVADVKKLNLQFKTIFIQIDKESEEVLVDKEHKKIKNKYSYIMQLVEEPDEASGEVRKDSGEPKVIYKDRLLNKIKGVLCETCGELFATQKKYDGHRHVDYPPEAEVATLDVDTNLSMDMDMDTAEPPDDFQNLEQSQPVKRDANSSQFKCEDCPTEFVHLRLLRRHIRVMHGCDTDENGQKRFCELCKKVIKKNFQDHMAAHNGEYKYKCEVCQKPLTTKARYQEHMDSHTKTKRHVCEICSQAYRHRSNLRLHVQRVHVGEQFVCPICGDSKPTNIELQYHLNVHNDHKPYKCSDCPESFHNSHDLYKHKRVTHYPRLVCNQCGKSFIYSSSFKEHMRSHLGIKNLECNVCHRKFLKRYTLKSHLLTHIKDQE